MTSPAKIVTARPSETAAPVAMAVAVLIGGYLSFDTTQLAALAIIVSFVPAAVTWIVELVRS